MKWLVVKVVSQILKVDPARVAGDARFVEDLGAESIKSVGNAVKFIEKLL